MVHKLHLHRYFCDVHFHSIYHSRLNTFFTVGLHKTELYACALRSRASPLYGQHITHAYVSRCKYSQHLMRAHCVKFLADVLATSDGFVHLSSVHLRLQKETQSDATVKLRYVYCGLSHECIPRVMPVISSFQFT